MRTAVRMRDGSEAFGRRIGVGERGRLGASRWRAVSADAPERGGVEVAGLVGRRVLGGLSGGLSGGRGGDRGRLAAALARLEERAGAAGRGPQAGAPVDVH